MFPETNYRIATSRIADYRRTADAHALSTTAARERYLGRVTETHKQPLHRQTKPARRA